MTQTVELDGVKHEFPDDFSRADIQKALMEFDNSADKKQPGILESAVKPITDIPSTYTGMVNDAVSQMGHGAEQIGQGDVIKGAGNMGLGALDYVTAPINAPVHTIVGEPIENATGSPAAGKMAELGASLLLPIPKGLPRLSSAAKVAEVPTSEALYSAATKGFEHPEVSNLAVKPSALKAFGDQTLQMLTEKGLDENIAAKTWGILKKLEKPAPNSVVTGKNIKSLRETLGNAAGSTDAKERKAATEAIKALDQFVAKLPQSSVLRGDPQKIGAIWDEARGNYAAAKRSDRITEALDKAELQAGSAHSGQNIDNATRQKIKSILISPKARRGYSGDELRQMHKIVMGTFTGDTARYVANLAGKGGGLGAVVASGSGAMAGHEVGGGIGAIVGAATPLVGYAFGKLSNAITANEIGKLQTLIRSRAPLADQVRGPLQDWSKASIAFTSSSTPRNIARLLVASRNLANNLKDAGITVSADSLIRSLQGPQSGSAQPSTPQTPVNEGGVTATPTQQWQPPQ